MTSRTISAIDQRRLMCYHALMRLTALCTMTLRYTSEVHVVRPFGAAGVGWGVGDGTVAGPGLSGAVEWSNHPTRRDDGTWLPDIRGVVTTPEKAEVIVELRGRTTFTDNFGQ